MSTINSEEYWDNRFKTDWGEYHGDDQSIFFANVALSMFPNWLKRELKSGGKTICDWGCAEGDGTYVLAKEFSRCKFVGIDFAETAIKTAKARYNRNNIDFIATDLLKGKYSRPHVFRGKYKRPYDIIFSSNTFEHFKDPWKVFSKVSSYAEELFILMIPFNESDTEQIQEHFYHFTEKDFRLQMKEWDIVHFEVKNTSSIPNTRWNGEQALIIFANKRLAEKKKLTLDQIKINTES